VKAVFVNHIRIRPGPQVLLAAVLALLLAAGCGIKKPPQPPRRKSPPAVKDLSLRLQGDEVLLSWSLAPEDEHHRVPAAGFRVYRFREPLEQKACGQCPHEFFPVADLPAGSAPLQTPAVRFRQKLEPGFRYGYKVTAYSRQGELGPASETVVVEY